MITARVSAERSELASVAATRAKYREQQFLTDDGVSFEYFRGVSVYIERFSSFYLWNSGLFRY